jgi:hypothetical protein
VVNRLSVMYRRKGKMEEVQGKEASVLRQRNNALNMLPWNRTEFWWIFLKYYKKMLKMKKKLDNRGI